MLDVRLYPCTTDPVSSLDSLHNQNEYTIAGCAIYAHHIHLTYVHITSSLAAYNACHSVRTRR